MADKTIQLKRGLKQNLPQHGIEGMPYFTMDTGEIYVGLGETEDLKKIAKQEKVITFVCKLGKSGQFGPIIKFPYKGKIISASVDCEIASASETILNIDKISELDYKSEIDNWSSILSTGLIIPSNKKFDNGTYVIQDNVVNKNDYFRLNMTQYSDIQNMVVQLTIELIDI